MAFLLEHEGKSPQIHDSAYVAPTATLCGDVSIGKDSCILFGAVLVGESGPVILGSRCIVHVRTRLPAGTKMPIGWIALGDPAEILPPDREERIAELLLERGFSKTAFGLEPSSTKELTERYARALGKHRSDTVLQAGEIQQT